MRCVLWATCVLPMGCREQELSRVESWRRDFAVLDREFPEREIDPWGRVSRETWRSEIAALMALPIARLTDAEIAWHIEHLLARYHDGHIKILADGSTAEPKYLPVAFRWFPTGIYVSAAQDSSLRGARVLRMGDTEAGSLLERVAPWVSVENESGLHAAVGNALFNEAVLADAGIAEAGRPVRVGLELASGERREVVLEPVAYAKIKWQVPGTLPMYRRGHQPENWMMALGDRQALYVRYAQCRDEGGSREIAGQLTRAMERDPKLRVVVDLRGNEGGDSAAFSPILKALRREGVADRHGLFVLTDRATFSSAFRNAVELRQMGARVVGEAPGQRPIYTGEVKSFALPGSRLQIRYTTKWARLGAAGEMELRPDVVLQPTAEEYFQGDDPILERVLAGPL